MAKTLATLARTYFEGGYRNNTAVMEIPDEAAELILKYWQERGDEAAELILKYWQERGDEAAELILKYRQERGMYQEETQEEEVFKQHFKDWEEEDDE